MLLKNYLFCLYWIWSVYSEAHQLYRASWVVSSIRLGKITSLERCYTVYSFGLLFFSWKKWLSQFTWTRTNRIKFLRNIHLSSLIRRKDKLLWTTPLAIPTLSKFTTSLGAFCSGIHPLLENDLTAVFANYLRFSYFVSMGTEECLNRAVARVVRGD